MACAVMVHGHLQPATGRRRSLSPQPLRQGELDGLCGVYSVVNAVRALCPEFRGDHSEHLFAELMVQLGQDGRAPVDVVCYGVGKRQLRKLIGSAGKYVEAHLAIELRARRIKASKNAKLTIKILWALLAKELKPGSVAILGLGGREDHWTLAYAITDRQIRLLDSSGRRVLRRSACTVRNDPKLVVLSARDITIIEREAGE